MAWAWSCLVLMHRVSCMHCTGVLSCAVLCKRLKEESRRWERLHIAVGWAGGPLLSAHTQAGRQAGMLLCTGGLFLKCV
jgi:hypothetical protein